MSAGGLHSRFEERLATGRSVVAAIRDAGPRFPLAYVDQLAAAAHDAHELSHTFGEVAALLEPDRHWHASCLDASPGHADEVSARIYAAVAGLELCWHLRRSGPQPAWARLPLHRLDCSRCAQTMRRPPAGEDDRCDWCGAVGVDWFTPVVLQMGPLITVGDAGPCCAGILQEVAA